MNIRQLVERYCPVYYFHREEHYFPITFKFVSDCDECVNTKCTPAFETCSGVSPPTNGIILKFSFHL